MKKNKKKTTKCLLIIRFKNFLPCLCEVEENPFTVLKFLREFTTKIDVYNIKINLDHALFIPSDKSKILSIDLFLKNLLFKKKNDLHNLLQYNYLLLHNIKDYFCAFELDFDHNRVNLYSNSLFPKHSIRFNTWTPSKWEKVIKILYKKINNDTFLTAHFKKN